MYKLAILLTTYNSGKYLPELIHSIQNQSYTDWNLFVRDDASTDNTIETLNEFTASDARIHLLQDNVKRGAMNGFFWLLEHVEAEVYMFCDHDDVWLSDKISLCKEALEREDNNVPVVVHSDLRVVDTSLSVIHESYWKFKHFTEKQFSDKYFHLVYNNITGCTMMFNRKAREVAMPPSKWAYMHDAWLAACVLWRGGKVVNVDKPLILYRQHGGNTIGANDVPTVGSQFAKLSSLVKKTHNQYKAVASLTSMNEFFYFVLKFYYMARIHMKI